MELVKVTTVSMPRAYESPYQVTTNRVAFVDIDGTLAMVDHRRRRVGWEECIPCRQGVPASRTGESGTWFHLSGDGKENQLVPCLASEEFDWKHFDRHMDEDTVNEPVADLVRSLDSAGWKIIVVSGRKDRYREYTSQWLLWNGISCHRLLMRGEGDGRPDHEIKKDFLILLKKEGLAPTVVIDDRNSVVSMWRAEGVTCFQVADGDF
jgi:hypothetical protein